MMPGYSETPLAQKLGIRPGMNILTIDAPKDYASILGPLPSGVSIVTKAKPGASEIVHLFAPTLAARRSNCRVRARR
jgi:hypothetical protein